MILSFAVCFRFLMKKKRRNPEKRMIPEGTAIAMYSSLPSSDIYIYIKKDMCFYKYISWRHIMTNNAIFGLQTLPISVKFGLHRRSIVLFPEHDHPFLEDLATVQFLCLEDTITVSLELLSLEHKLHGVHVDQTPSIKESSETMPFLICKT